MKTKKIWLNSQDGLLIAFIVGLTLLLVVRDIMAVSISKYIFLAYVALFLAVAKYETMVNMLCFVFPLVCGLPGTYIMPIALVLLVIKRKKINLWQLGLIVFVAFMELVACFWYPTVDIPLIVQYVSFAGTMFFMIHDDSEIDYLKCVRLFFWGTSVLCIIIMIAGFITAPTNWLEQFAEGQFRFGNTQADAFEGMKLTLNANALAYYSVVGMACGIFIADAVEKAWTRFIYVVFTVLCSLAGFLTISRSWLLVTIFCLLFYLITKMKTLRGILVAVAVFAVLTIAVSLFVESNPVLAQGFITRFTDDTIQGGNGRTEIMIKHMDQFLQSPRQIFMGTGVTQASAITGIKEALHNGTQQILVNYGFLGFVVFMIGLIKPFIDTRKIKTKEGMACGLIPAFAAILFVQTIQFLNPMMQMLPYVAGVFAFKACGNGSE